MTGPRVLLTCDFHLKYSAGLARGLAERGAAVTLLSRTHDLEFGGRSGESRRYVEGMLDGRARYTALGGRAGDVRSLPVAWRLRREIAEFAPEAVHFQDQVVNDPRLVLASGVPPRAFALTVHDPVFHPGQSRAGIGRDAGRRWMIRKARLIFVHADALRDELLERERITGTVVVVPHGIGAASVAPLPEGPSLLFFGRLSVYKGLDTLLDAMPLVWERVPEATLTVAGDGPLEAHPVLADERVSLRHEHVPEADVPDLFARSTCLVLPYRQASQSGVGGLAKRYGRAIVATAVGGLPELVGDEMGRVVPPEDPAALAAALIEVLTVPGLSDSLGAAAAERGQAEAGWPRIAELTLDAYARHLPPRSHATAS
jgi:glycosyltransferase involved in cell wall biosynthesis